MPDAVGKERVDVRVEADAVAEALDRAEGCAVAVADAVLGARALAVEAGDGANPDGKDLGQELVVVGDAITKPEWKRDPARMMPSYIWMGGVVDHLALSGVSR